MLREDMPEGSSHGRMYIALLSEEMGSNSASFWHAKSSMADSIVRLGTNEHAALRAPVLPF